MCGGSGPTGIGFVDNAIDKADNWTEAAGEQLADIDPGPAIGKVGEDIDKNVLQPMAQDPVGTAVTIAAVATGQYYLLPYIAAANTAIKGGKLEDIALSFGTAYVGAKVAPGLNQYYATALTPTLGAAAPFAAAVGTGATIGSGAGATRAAVKGKSIGDAALKGGVVGGVVGGVSYGVSKGYDLAKSELGFGVDTPPDIQAASEFGAAQADSLRTQPGGVSDEYMADILRQEGMDPFVAQDVATLTNQGVGEAAVAQNIASSYSPGEVYTPPRIGDNGLDQFVKKNVSKAISSSILDGVFGTPEMPNYSRTFTRRGSDGVSGEDQFYDDASGGSGDLAPVTQSKYELRKFVNPTGDTKLVSFKDDKPEAPIPEGYTEEETIGAAKGGLIDRSPTTMVKYSKKPLVANRKTITKPKEKVTTRKGLGVKKK